MHKNQVPISSETISPKNENPVNRSRVRRVASLARSRLWLADWGTHEVVAVDLDGESEVVVRLRFPSFQPICIDWLPDGHLLIVSSTDRLLLRREEPH